MNIFDCAIKMEEEARLYYEKLAAVSVVPELRNLFTLLAESEQEHHDALVKMKKNCDSQKIQFKDLQDAACLFRPLLSKRDLVADIMEESDEYQLIVKGEEEGVLFYEGLAGQTEDEDTRRILHMIANEERKHLSIVKNIYSFVESPKSFLAWGEFSNLKEY